MKSEIFFTGISLIVSFELKKSVRAFPVSGIKRVSKPIFAASLIRFSRNITFFTFPVRDISHIKATDLPSFFELFDDIILAARARSRPGSAIDIPLEMLQ